MTNKEYEESKKQIEQENFERKRRRELRNLRREGRFEFKKPSWSKTMMVAIFAICVEILIYSEVIMWRTYDLSALYALIAVPAALFGTFWSYSEKSKVENSANGIVYETAMMELKKKMEEESSDDFVSEGEEDSDAAG